MRNTSRQLVTAEVAATVCGCSVATIWRRARAGELDPVHVLGRSLFRLEQAEALARANGREPAAVGAGTQLITVESGVAA